VCDDVIDRQLQRPIDCAVTARCWRGLWYLVLIVRDCSLVYCINIQKWKTNKKYSLLIIRCICKTLPISPVEIPAVTYYQSCVNTA